MWATTLYLKTLIMSKTPKLWLMLDGELKRAKDARASYFSQSMHYGISVFEGIRAYQTDEGPHLFQAEAHFSRLKYSAEVMGLALPYSIDEMVKMSYQVLHENKFLDAYIRPLVFGGTEMSLVPADESHLLIAAWKWNSYYGDKLTRLRTSSYRRPDPRTLHLDAKISGHYVNSVMATAEAKRFGFDDSLQLDCDGFVAEASAANIFFEKDGKLFTPGRGSILPGITRQTVMDMAREFGYHVEEGKFSLEDLKSADACFLAGTAAEVAGVESIDETKFPLHWEDSIGFQLASRYRQMVRKPNTEKTII